MSLQCCAPRIVHVSRKVDGYTEHKTYEVPCGVCYYCRERSVKEWQLRLWLEMEVSRSCFFLTLTYDEEHVPSDGQLDVTHFQGFMKRMRRGIEYHCKKSGVSWIPLRVFYVGEYGETDGRPHFHAVVFNIPANNKFECEQLVASYWPFGFCGCEDTDKGLIKYAASYTNKLDPREHKVAPFRRMSSRPALGMKYFELHPEYIERFKNQDFPSIRTRAGYKYQLPRYFIRKFLSEMEQIEYRRRCRARKRQILRNQKAIRDLALYQSACVEESNRMLEVIKRKRFPKHYVYKGKENS